MSEKDQIDQLSNELDNLVERFRKEYDITYASAIGVLQLKIHSLGQEATELEEEV